MNESESESESHALPLRSVSESHALPLRSVSESHALPLRSVSESHASSVQALAQLGEECVTEARSSIHNLPTQLGLEALGDCLRLQVCMYVSMYVCMYLYTCIHERIHKSQAIKVVIISTNTKDPQQQQPHAHEYKRMHTAIQTYAHRNTNKHRYTHSGLALQ
jgi:hypothetical protein